jgi:hypothetical protein
MNLLKSLLGGLKEAEKSYPDLMYPIPLAIIECGVSRVYPSNFDEE